MLHPLSAVSLTPIEKLSTEIEHKTTYSLDRCELNIFETHKSAEKVALTFGGFAVTSMLRGKKVLHEDNRKINYSLGETYVLPASAPMVIDFPDADYANPTQCTALVIDNSYLTKQLDFLNEHFCRNAEDNMNWELSSTKALLRNNVQVSTLGNQLISLFSSNDPLRAILIDLKLKELVLTIMQLHNYTFLVKTDREQQRIHNRFEVVVNFIRANLSATIKFEELCRLAGMSKSVFYRSFLKEYGVTPSQLLVQERINRAKQLLKMEQVSIKEVCYACGFTDPNYFSRTFKMFEGQTPSEFAYKFRRPDLVS